MAPQDRRVELKPELVEALCLGLAQPLLRLQLIAEGGAGVAGVRGTAVGLPMSADTVRELARATAGAHATCARRTSRCPLHARQTFCASTCSMLQLFLCKAPLGMHEEAIVFDAQERCSL